MTVEPRPTVLIVDDEPVNRELLAAFLHGIYEVVQATSGEEALVAATAQLPDLVLCDVMMPGMDGFETTRRLKALAGTELLPVVLVTALGDTGSRVRGFDAGADEFVTKPVDRRELLARLRNLDQIRRDRRALAEQNRHLIRLRQFEQQAIFLMVHDLKNPLAAVALNMGFAQMQLRRLPGTDEAQSALDDARTACSRLQRLIAEVLDTSRIENGQLHLAPVNVDAASLIASAVEDFRRRATDENTDLSIIVGDLRLQVDVDLTRRALQALVENCFKFISAGQRIEIAAADFGPDEVVLQVSSSAPAMSPASQAQAFEKHVPEADQPSGTVHRGHGLYYARMIAEAHGGRAEMADHPELTTSFRMILPRTARTPLRR